MIANGTPHSNGYITPWVPNEPAPASDWRGQLAPYTHSLQWTDGDGCSHSLTLRADTLEALLADLRLVKQGIKIAKTKATAQSSDTPQQPDVMRCEIHGVDMPRRWSKRTNGDWFGHKTSDGGFCYGRPAKA